MTPQEIIDVVTAFRDGKKVEMKPILIGAEQPWRVDLEPHWNFWACNYRVAREPRRVWFMFQAETTVHTGVKPVGPDWIEFVEVMK